ncbi:oligosaccharide flippase family protein [Stutzerimonas nitrititolerans]|uniref:oligosaccharide flippase family protein n=1 Tax=Stutzerimonas nitrititolerans TaxID=2482751 RepID=UPI002897E754|nr:oligosaccharide flippase family protein [Stutzerimonas nitrititolerans]
MKIRRLTNLHNSIFGILGFFIPTVILFFSYRILANQLGEVQFGVYLVVTSISAIAASFDLGMSSANVKFVAEAFVRDRKSIPNIVLTSMCFYFLLSGLTLLLALLVSIYFPAILNIPDELEYQIELLFLLPALQVGAMLMMSCFVGVLKALNRFDLVVTASIVFPVVALGLGSYGVLSGWYGLIGLLWVGVLAAFFSLCFSMFLATILCRKEGLFLLNGRPKKLHFREMFGFSSILTLHSLVAVFFNQIQRLLISGTAGPAAVALFQLPYSALSKVHALINSASEFIYPVASSSSNYSSLRSTYKKLMGIAAAVAILILGSISLYAEIVFGIWLGDSIALKVAPLVWPISVAFFFIALSAPVHHILNGVGLPGWNVLYSVINVFLYLSYLLIHAKKDLVVLDFAYAFAFSNVLSGVFFQLFMEFYIWKKICRILQ